MRQPRLLVDYQVAEDVGVLVDSSDVHVVDGAVSEPDRDRAAERPTLVLGIRLADCDPRGIHRA